MPNTRAPVTWTQRLALGAAGLIALGVGAALLSDPIGFYAGSGVQLPQEPSLLSELRAPAAALVALGAVILAGAARPVWAPVSALVGAVVFLGYAAGRLISIGVDGLPSEALLLALGIEIVVGGLCLAAAPRRKRVTAGAVSLSAAG